MLRKRAIVLPHFFQQPAGSQDISFDKGERTIDGSVDVGFRREIDDGIRLVSRKNLTDQVSVTDVPDDQFVLRMVIRGQRIRVSGVREFVQINHPDIATPGRSPNKTASNKSGPAGDQERVQCNTPEFLLLSCRTITLRFVIAAWAGIMNASILRNPDIRNLRRTSCRFDLFSFQNNPALIGGHQPAEMQSGGPVQKTSLQDILISEPQKPSKRKFPAQFPECEPASGTIRREKFEEGEL